MKVLLCNRPDGAFGFISDGWYNAFINKRHSVARWDGELDSWLRFNPDIYIGCSGHKQQVPVHRGRCKIAIHVNPYGPVKIKDIDETPQNITWTMAQRPDVVFGYGHDTDRILWSYWQDKVGVPWVPMPTAGDAVIYHDQYAGNENKATDVVYLGGRWPYKGKSIDKYLLPVLRDGRITSKVYGWGEWPDNLSLGSLPDSDVCRFIASGRVAPCVSEPHTQTYGFDVPERMFKAALCGTLVVHDSVPDLKKLMLSVVVAQNPSNFLDLCVHYSRPENQNVREELARQQRREVLEGQTYHHRLSGLLAALNFPDEASDMVVGISD